MDEQEKEDREVLAVAGHFPRLVEAWRAREREAREEDARLAAAAWGARQLQTRPKDTPTSVLLGEQYGLLVVEAIMTPGCNGLVTCRCECGRMTTVRANNLTSGVTESCGTQDGVRCTAMQARLKERRRREAL